MPELDDDQQSYHSSSDSDFDDNAAVQAPDSESESEAEAPAAAAGRRVQRADTDADNKDADLASGDEVVVNKAQRKKRRKSHDSDDDGEAGLVKTRAQRAKEKIEKKRGPLASTEGATIDVDAIWHSMTSGQPQNVPEPDQAEPEQPEIPAVTQAPNQEPENTVTISRTYKFAGQTMTERKQVLASSAEAKLHLESQAASERVVNDQGLWRPKRRANPFDITGAKENLVLPVAGPKLNMVEKSKLDWAGFVDREGIKDQLDEASRAKDGYLGRMDFLGRVEANREDEMRAARLKNK